MSQHTAFSGEFHRIPSSEPFTVFGMTPEETEKFIEWCDAEEARIEAERMEQAAADAAWVERMQQNDALRAGTVSGKAVAL